MKVNKKKFLYYILGILGAIILSILIINIYVFSFGKTGICKCVGNDRVGLVLGASVYGNKIPSDILKDRLKVAFDSYEKGEIAKILLSGDNSISEYNEPLVMKKYLLELGVREDDLYLDYAGFDTYDSIYRSRDIFGVKKVIIFTQDYHLRRAVYISKKLGIDTFGIAADLNSYKGSNYFNFREIFARVKAFIEVEIIKPKPKFLGEKILIEFNTEEELQLRKILDKIDLESDNSIQKFVNNKVSFENVTYVPENLVYVEGDYIFDSKGNSILKEVTLDALKKMSEDFYNEFGKKLVVFSGYRSYLYQKGIKDRGCPDNLCAKAGYSEHQSGLAFDLWEATTEGQFLSRYSNYFEWLKENAHKYGFHNTYQKGLEVDGYEIEPWHWRYIGIELATYLKENNLTFAELYNKKKPD